MNETYRERSLPIGWLVLLIFGAAFAVWAIFFGPDSQKVSAGEKESPALSSNEDAK